MENAKKSFHKQVAKNLIEQLKQGTAPWQKPWKPGDPLLTLPNNPTTGKNYRGINVLHLMSQGRTDPRWLTYKQAASLGAQVKKGEKSTLVQYWKFFDEHIKTDDSGKPVLDGNNQPIKEKVRLERPRVFYASVFNAEQIDNLPELNIEAPDWEPLDRAEQIMQASNAVIQHGEHDRAFYRPSTDSIHLPHKHQFQAPDQYYATALHELGHWSGHESRLNRDLSHPFGSEGYAKEELRAEIASMLIGGELRIGHDPGQHAAYVDVWIKALQADHNEIFRAASDAEKIKDYVLAFSQQQEIVEQEEIKVNKIMQQSATYSDDLSPDLATIVTHNIAAFKSLTTELPKNELYALYLVAEVRKFYKNGSIDNLEFEEKAQNKLGFTIPADWTGRVQIAGKVTQQDEEGNQVVLSAESLGVKPQFWGVYALRDDNNFQLLKDVDTEHEAQVLAEQLTLIDAESGKNEYEKSVKLANIYENRVRSDSKSSDEAILLAKEQRKQAESIAMLNDKDFQKRKADIENDLARQDSQGVSVWHSKQANQNNDKDSRQYLVVPYAEKDLAKTAGGYWDNKAKAWYVGPQADIRALQRWFPENVAKQQEPVLSPQTEFADLLRANGCIVDGHHPVMDGTKQRIKVEGDKSGEKSGFYVGHLDGHPAGYFTNNRTKFETQWKAKGYSLSDAQKAELVTQVTIKQQKRKAEQHEQQLRVAKVVNELLAIAPVADAEHLYLKDKNARPDGLKIVPQNANDLPDDSIIKIGQDYKESMQLREDHPERIVFTAGELLLPIQDIDGQIWGVQTIQPSGAKYFVAGSKKENNFYVAGNGTKNALQALNAVPVIVIAEGYATADTLSQTLGYPTVAAFDSGNLSKVAQDLRDKYPNKPIIIAGDDDRQQEITNGKNPGREKALEAAELVNGAAVFPIFAPNEQASQNLSDFNDLANISVLGIDAVKRQVGSVVEKVSQQGKAQKLQVCIEQQAKNLRRASVKL